MKRSRMLPPCNRSTSAWSRHGQLAMAIGLLGVLATAPSSPRNAIAAPPRKSETVEAASVEDASLRPGELAADGEKALAEFRAKVVASPGDRTLWRELAARHEALGEQERKLGRLSLTLRQLEEGFEIRRRIALLDPKDANAVREAFVACRTLGEVCLELDQTPMAIEYFERCRDEAEAAADASPDGETLKRLAQVYEALGDAHWRLGQSAEAIGHFRRLVEVRRSLLNSLPEEVAAARELARALERLATGSLAFGQPSEGVARLEQGINLLKSFEGDDSARRDLGEYHRRLGDVWLDADRPERAAQDYSQCLAIAEAILNSHPEDLDARRDLAAALDRTGQMHMIFNRWEEATASFERSLKMKRQIVGELPQDVRSLQEMATSLVHLALAARRTNRVDAALAHYERALGILRELAVAEPMDLPIQHDLVRVHSNRAEMDIERHRYAAANESLLRARATIAALSVRLRHNPFEEEAVALDKAFRHCERAEQMVLDFEQVPSQPAQERARWLRLRVRALATYAVEHEAEIPAKVVARWPGPDRPLGLIREARLSADALSAPLFNDPGAFYDAACCYGVCLLAMQKIEGTGRDDETKTLELRALAALRSAISAGWSDRKQILQDPDLAPIRQLAEFEAIVKAPPPGSQNGNGLEKSP